MSLPSINFLHLTVTQIQARQTYSRQPPAHPDTMGENNTLTALKRSGVKGQKFEFLKIGQGDQDTGFVPLFISPDDTQPMTSIIWEIKF